MGQGGSPRLPRVFVHVLRNGYREQLGCAGSVARKTSVAENGEGTRRGWESREPLQQTDVQRRSLWGRHLLCSLGQAEGAPSDDVAGLWGAGLPQRPCRAPHRLEQPAGTRLHSSWVSEVATDSCTPALGDATDTFS